MKRFAIVGITSIWLLTACQNSTPTAAPVTVAPTTRSAQLSTATPLATSTPLAVPTLAPVSVPAVTAAPSPAPASAVTPTPVANEMFVNTDTPLNLRAEASAAGTLIQVLAPETHLIALDAATEPDAAGIAWQNVRTDDGQAGWVAAQYLSAVTPTPVSTATPATDSSVPAGYVYVASTEGLNLRVGHFTRLALVTTLANGQRLQTNGLTFGPDTEGLIWLNVKTEDGLEGWVSADFISAQVPSVAPAQSATNDSDVVNELLRRTNELRVQNGLPPFRLDVFLSELALEHSVYMSQNGITHTGADGHSATKRLKSLGFNGQPTENIFGGQASVDDAWEYWSTDPPHLANLLGAANTIIGIGVFQSGAATYYTQDFAQPPTQ